MAENSKIEWTTHTFNPWIGCTKVAPGCTHCYAEVFSKRTGKAKWGAEGTRVKTSEAYWAKPLKWDRDAAAAGERPRVFCASMADVFEDSELPVTNSRGETLYQFPDGELATMLDHAQKGISCGRLATLDNVRRELFELIDATPNLDWLLLTKRPQSIYRLMHATGAGRRDNLWLGTSISDQATAEANVMPLLRCAPLAERLFLSIEPLLGPIDLRGIDIGLSRALDCLRGEIADDELYSVSGAPHFIDWVIVGGESGHHARPMHPDWVRRVRDDCQIASVPFFFKQWGEWQNGSGSGLNHIVLADGRHGALPEDMGFSAANPAGWHALNPTTMSRVGKKAAGRSLDGREWNEFPRPVAQKEARQ